MALLLISAGRWAFPPRQVSWNADAGVVPSFTRQARAVVSSNPAQAGQIIDGNPETAWQSDAPLPTGFVSRPDLNIFLGKKTAALAATTDGDLNTSAPLLPGVSVEWKTEAPHNLVALSLKAQTDAPLEIWFDTPDQGAVLAGTYDPADNFRFRRFEWSGGSVEAVRLVAGARARLFEVAALGELPTEYAIIDLGGQKPVGTVYTRHWAGNPAVESASLLWSADGKNWTRAADLFPDALATVVTNIVPQQAARFLKIEYVLPLADWQKVQLWEVRAYDQFGHFGAMPEAEPGHVSIGDLMGVNGYWGWGTQSWSDAENPNVGPALFRPVAGHARNYHDLTWDLPTPDTPMDFEAMAAGKGTPAKAWLNWDREYRSWAKTGFHIQASIQFYRFKDTDWRRPTESAYAYGEGFARHFGATTGNGLICSMEVGNEPWEYDAAVYRKILSGMARGAKAGDPAMEVFPCALQAADPEAEVRGPFKNYIGARIFPEHFPLLDGINIHAYSYRTNFWGRREATFPEHPNSTFREIFNAIRWRNHNMPGKKIYLSEWGWDCAGGGEACAHAECVSEKAAAAYAARGVFIAQRLGIDRATWYFFANADAPSSLYTRSGLTGSVSTGFKKKAAFEVLQKIMQNIENQYFMRILREDDEAWIYLLSTPDGRPSHVVGWRPVKGDEAARRRVSVSAFL
ncbi:MAG: hypothetical protein D6714_17260, partial [Bacteroidetes bacterium]